MKFPPGEGMDVPPAVVTVIGTVFAPGGLVASISVCEITWNDSAAPAAPKLTAVAPVKLVPASETTVPPVLGPDPGRQVSTTAGPGGLGAR